MKTSVSAHPAATPDYLNSMRIRAGHLAANAVGKPYSIRTTKKTVVDGIITGCEFAYFRNQATSVSAVFKVTMECGTAKASRQFFVKRVPS